MTRTNAWKHRNYYDALSTIPAIAAGYDGYNPKSAKQMRKLILDLVEVAAMALKNKAIMVDVSGDNIWDNKGKKRRHK